MTNKNDNHDQIEEETKKSNQTSSSEKEKVNVITPPISSAPPSNDGKEKTESLTIASHSSSKQ